MSFTADFGDALSMVVAELMAALMPVLMAALLTWHTRHGVGVLCGTSCGEVRGVSLPADPAHGWPADLRWERKGRTLQDRQGGCGASSAACLGDHPPRQCISQSRARARVGNASRGLVPHRFLLGFRDRMSDRRSH